MRVQNANTHIRHSSHVPTVAMAQSEARTDEVKPLVSCSNRVRQASSPLKDHETHGSRVWLAAKISIAGRVPGNKC